MSESVQWAVLGTALLLGVLGLTEAGLMLHGRTVAVSAALAGAQAQAQLNAKATAGAAVATDIAITGGLSDVQVTVVRSSVSVTLRVDASVPSFIGWAVPRVRAESTHPLEGR